MVETSFYKICVILTFHELSFFFFFFGKNVMLKSLSGFIEVSLFRGLSCGSIGVLDFMVVCIIFFNVLSP